MNAIITLTTDFGTSDGYVAAMKGVILGINPRATIVDICHTIQPQNITQAAFVLSTVYRYFPKQTIHLAVVDPGVGSDRRAIILRTPLADFVAPDNGILSYIINDLSKPSAGSSSALNSDIPVTSLTKPEFWHSPVSHTFHGRDILAPVAAHLSLGVRPDAFGESITSPTVLPILQTRRMQNGSLLGQIIHIDNFGNLITNIRETDLPQERGGISISIGGKWIHGLSLYYAERNGLLALIGGNGYMEVSLKNGSASEFLGVGPGDQVRVIQPIGGK